MTCWAHSVGNCDDKISREHYITNGLYDSKMVRVRGFPWCKNEPIEISLKNAVGKILCIKHNSFLSQYDEEAIKLVRFLNSVHADKESTHRKITINGKRFEKWALKTAINLSYLKAFDGIQYKPNPKHVEMLFKDKPINRGVGLYFLDGKFQYREAVSWVEVRVGSSIVAIVLQVNTLQFYTCLVRKRADRIPHINENVDFHRMMYHPKTIYGKSEQTGKYQIKFRW